MINGKRISGRYKILDLIGGGGMANVYLAHDMILDREVAIKMLRVDFANEEEFIKRFQREAHSATSLAHPNIVNIFDVGEEEDINYIVMEYVKGMTLKQYIQQYSPISVEKALDIMKQLTSAMSHAHQNHIIHRDIKPQNILIDSDGNVKITDFGIAMALSATSITQTNAVLGSVHYLSPEQARGGMATKKSDIYSLGIVMFELLTGRLPFSGESAVSIALKHLQSETPSLRRWNNTIPQSVENIVLKATAKDPFHRYASLEEMEEDFGTALAPERQNEPKFNVPLDDDATKAIPVITNDSTYSNLDDTIVHHQNDIAEPTKPTETVSQDTSKKKKVKKKKEKKEKKKKWPFVVIGLFFFIILLGVGTFTVLPDLLGPKDINIPDVSGKEYDEAISILADKGFEIGDTNEQFNEEIPEDVVIKTSPKAGRTAKEGSEINIYVSKGKETVEMEDFVDKQYADIASALEEEGFTVEKEEVYNESAPGTILEQTPASGEEVIPDETTITFTISKGQETFELTDLTQYNQKALEDYGELTGLKINISSEEYSDEVTEGLVISQTPKQGTPMIKGETVNVVLSKGKEPQVPKDVSVEVTIPYEPAETVETEGENPQTEEKKPQTVEIYVEDIDSNITEMDQIFSITETTKKTLNLTIEPNKEGKYKIIRDGQVYEEKSIAYPTEEES
ncbi:Stk1 family PASTA domain-containing Ser/Thr kinase [Bacillus seohaeanensis]|uniref:non-specific serine/threonine protein kinase n=1 Tax=Bacillus seohaeanensis TaxID=284580 RepID=A0ABW5RWP0_9BACI